MDNILRVTKFVEENLTSDITIEDIASVSGYSVRHFQRSFRESTGESIMEYVRGRRLTVAMSEITTSAKPIIEIAFEYQFESQQSFTRAFQSRFMFPPRRFRNNKLLNPPSAKQRITEEYLNMVERNELTLEPTIIVRQEKQFVGMQITGDLNSFADPTLIPRISALAKEFNTRSYEIDQSSIVDSESPGLLIITYRVPIEERAKGDGIVLMVGLEISSSLQAPQGMHVISVQQSQYAKFEFTGVLQNFNLASYYVAGCWFPRAKYWIGNAPLFNYVQIQGVNSDINKSIYLLPLRARHDRLVDIWWEHES